MQKKGFALWLTGLPGAGKSTIAQKLIKLLRKKNMDIQQLRLDKIRKAIVPNPEYTERERDVVYNALVLLTELLTANKVNVLIDATAHRRRWREKARTRIERYAEVWIKCPLELCMERESRRKDNLVLSNLYKKALERLRTGKQHLGLGEVIGVDVPYEAPTNAELIVDTEKLSPQEAAQKISVWIEKFLLGVKP